MRNFTPALLIILVVILLASVAAVTYFKGQTPPALNTTDSSQNSEAKSLAANAEYLSTDAGILEDNFSEASISGTPVPSKAPLSDYKYPGAQIISQSDGKIEMGSNDDTQTITDWYKDKIRQLGFNAKSFTQTNTNGLILNNLSAAKPGDKITITIKKDQTMSIVSITVDRS